VPRVLRMARWCHATCSHATQLYHLRSVVVHKGFAANSGHYVAYVNAATDSCNVEGSSEDWILMDDGFVSRASESAMDELLAPMGAAKSSATPYLLFYEMEDPS
jgi:uncharacterized UBP type Zn finger protein